MTPFDLLFFALVAVLVLIIAGEMWLLLLLRRKPPADDGRLDPWIQLRPEGTRPDGVPDEDGY
jgi:hypothetical protein